jgi:hypothetical protein
MMIIDVHMYIENDILMLWLLPRPHRCGILISLYPPLALLWLSSLGVLLASITQKLKKLVINLALSNIYARKIAGSVTVTIGIC